jgi:hypothetical protein
VWRLKRSAGERCETPIAPGANSCPAPSSSRHSKGALRRSKTFVGLSVICRTPFTRRPRASGRRSGLLADGDPSHGGRERFWPAPRSTRRPTGERKLLRRTQFRHSPQDSGARPISVAYLMIPSACFGSRATSSLDIAKLSAISDAGFPASHFEIEISSNTGLLKRIMNFVGSLPTCST